MSHVSSPTGTTKVAALLGYPATYSVSPTLHNAAYVDMGLDAIYVVFPTRPEALGPAVEAVRALNLLGVSVTMPHKEAAVAFCDSLSDEARLLGAVNCIVVTDGKLVGHNTDGSGFVASLQSDLEFSCEGKHCVVIGGGGAAKAVVAALSAHGASEVVVINRSADRARETALLAGSSGRVGSIDDIVRADLVVNATSVGMVGEHEGISPIPSGFVHAKQVVVDLIYKPERTVFLQDAEHAGARIANGLGMLAHQAAAQIELWTGRVPSIDVMRSAVRESA